MKARTKTATHVPPWLQPGSGLPGVSEAVRDIAETVFARIVKGQYQYGGRLPPERKLGEEFKVSRTLVRKAFDLLETHGFVSPTQGHSRYVVYRREEPAPPQGADHGSAAPQGDIAESTSPLELNVVRSIVEPEIARLAIINMSARDIANLRAIVDKMSAVTTSARDFARWDGQFHMALAEGARNTLLTAIYRLINDVRRHAHWNATREKTLSPNRIRDYQKLYRSICASLEARDIENAVEFVKLVMVEAQRDLTMDS